MKSLKWLLFCISQFGHLAPQWYPIRCLSPPLSFHAQLHVTSKTTCREIVSLVVQQLNKAVEAHGLDSPLYLEEQWADFGLVAVVGSKEYPLRDEHCPLQLQNPWTKGHLYVRTKEAGGVVQVVGRGPSTAV